MNQTIKSTASFPEVARIRKGSAQTQKDGKTQIGKDLGQKLRIAFEPGNDEIARRFEEMHGGFLVDRIHAMIPFDMNLCWSHGYEAYSSGGRVALVDDETENYIMLRNPNTFEYEVLDGQPEKKFIRGESIQYERNGKTYKLAIKPFSRLKLFLPELERFVFVLLQSTSFYDRENLKAQLSAIQMIADTVNHGSVSGIPFDIYRMPKSVLWKSDSGAKRVEKWLLNIEIDPSWVSRATQRMGALAMSFGQLPMLIEGTDDPDSDEDDEEVHGAGITPMGDDPVQAGFHSPYQLEQGEVLDEETSEEQAPAGLDLSTHPQLRAYLEMGLQAALGEKDASGVKYSLFSDDQLVARFHKIEDKLINNNMDPKMKEVYYLKRDAIITILKSRQGHGHEDF